MTKRYNDFTSFLDKFFPYKVQKISVNAGLTCPNRDGTVGVGGCTFCNNETFSPEYCLNNQSVTEQIKEGIKFFSHKYPKMKYLAYFQSYTNTYGNEPQLISLYEEALNHPSVAGLIIGTRPDCMPDTLLNYFEKSAQKHFLIIEYGMESALDKTLVRINRGHTHMDTENAIRRTANRGILTGAHLILGLPGETREDMLNHARIISKLPLATLKLHQLQLIRYTKMAEEYALSPEQFHFPTIDEYIDLVIDFVELLSPNIALERFVSQSPAHLLIAPNWKLKNHVIADKVDKRMEERNTRQGKLYSNK